MTPNPEYFNITERDGLRLILPKHEVGNAGWTTDTVRYRSRVETLEGEGVSLGFRKFFNLQTGPTELQVTGEDVLHYIGKGDAIATLKLDGSLLIRSTHKGKVILRTRGSFGYEFLDNAADMEIFKTKYPSLFNPVAWESMSLLFEWTSPNNVIVLKYPEPELTLIGAIWNKSGNYMRVRALESLSRMTGVPLVKWFKLDKDGWEYLQSELAANNEVEGWVLRLGGEQVLVKVKCQPYLTKHALKSTLTTEKLADMWMELGQPDFTAFIEHFIKSFDEETYLWALGAISALFDGVKELRAIVSHMTKKAQDRSGLSRKDAAIAGLAEYGQTKRFSAYISIWEGSGIRPEILKSILLQSTKQTELGMFQTTGDTE